jgi:hypothetical protein
MTATKETFARAVEGLVRKFDTDKDTYLSPGYGEAQARSHFITPFFKALGWDVENEKGLPYNLCEVWEEKGETEGRPDYAFRISGQTKFFIEAKAPSVPLSNVQHILQTKGYAWNSGDVLLAGITDFEELRFFDASLRPDERHPLAGEKIHLLYTEYLSNVDRLWELSRERVAAGSLDQFLPKGRESLRRRQAVDAHFLDDLNDWRHDLAKSIHTHNPGLDSRLLNEIVQRLLDRIVFIRIAEDRKVIEPRQLWDVADLWEESGARRPVMEFLVDLFATINNDFNGEIFKSHACEKVKVESGVLAGIIRRLYPPKSPYRFDVIGVELLGSIYERYLGNTLHVTARQVSIKPKPEVRKAGGVYYTPKFIVDYIVKNTVGKLVEGKTPKQVEKLRMLDPACGSGSFLIGAFQYLIDWHLNYYREHPKEARVHPMYPEVEKDGSGNPRLSFHAKTRIMSHNLYGVDLDPQAVEITMMSLYLKALEGEQGMLGPKHEKLPELKYNIRCGNSLIGPDIEKESPLTPEERERIRPFDWHSREEGFGDILAAGGFDAVIGNPPYVRMEGFKEIKDYLRQAYQSHDERSDLYVYFVEKSHEVLKVGGRYGMIVSNKFLRAGYGAKLRQFLRTRARLDRIVDFAGLPVFLGATVRTIVLLTSKNGSGRPARYAPPVEARTFDAIAAGAVTIQEAIKACEYEVPAESLAGSVWGFGRREHYSLLKKIQSQSTRLIEYCDGKICMGVKSGLAEAFVIDGETRKSILKANSRAHEIIKPFLNGRNIRRYQIQFPGTYLLYLYHGIDIRKYPAVERHLRPYRTRLERRATRQKWYELQQPQLNFAEYMAGPKIVFPDIATEPRFALDQVGYFGSNTTYFIPLEDLYLLGLLNSRVGHFYFQMTCAGLEGKKETYLRFFGQYLEGFPVRRIDTWKASDQKLHDGIVERVERISELNKKKHSGKLLPSELARIEREIAAADAEIDDLVYELYGITAEERKIIEEAAGEAACG